MANKRLEWLDQLKGLAVITSLFLYFSTLLMKDFNPAHINSMANALGFNFINNLEIFTQMGLILISAFSFSFIIKKSTKWFGKKFISLVIISTLLIATGQDHRSLFWQMLQSLWFYFPLLYLINQQSSLAYKGLIWVVLMILYHSSLPLWGDLAQSWSYLGAILFGGITHQVSFNIMSGIPMVVLSTILTHFLVVDKTLITKRIAPAMGILGSILIIGFLLNKYILTSAVIFRYPPYYFEFLSGALAVLGSILIINKFSLNYLTLIGRRGLMIYWGIWLYGSFFIEWNSWGLYSFNLISSSAIIFIALGLIIGIINYREKKPYAKQ